MHRITNLSIIVPVYSGERFLRELFDRISRLRHELISEDAPLQITELIFVDDSSTDNSEIIINEISHSNYWVSVITLSTNFGQHAATVAGILHSTGSWVVTLDEDLQHPPEFIVLLLKEAINKKLDVVYANPIKGPHGNWYRNYSSKYFKKFMVVLTGEKSIPLFNSFRLIRGEVARCVSSFSSNDTYFDVGISWVTKRVGGLSLDLKEMRIGQAQKSGYSVLKLFSHARKLIFSSRLNIARVIALLSLIVFISSFAFGLSIYLGELNNPGLYGSKGWPSIMITILVMGSVSIVLLTVVLEYISKIAIKLQGRPVFNVITRNDSKELTEYLNKKYGSH